MLDEHYFDLIDETSKLVADLEQESDEEWSEKIAVLLRHIDMVHREGLLRLTDALRARDAGALLDQIVEQDTAVKILLGLYGLADLQLPPEDAETRPPPREGSSGFFPLERLSVRRTQSTPSTSPSAAGRADLQSK